MSLNRAGEQRGEAHNDRSPIDVTSRYETASTLANYTLAQQPSESYTALAKYCTTFSQTSVSSFCGAMGGVASGIVTCPLDVIKTKLQAQGSFRPGRRAPASSALYQGMVGTARVIWREDGLRGMYRGLGPMLLGYLPTWAVYMSVYETSRDYYSTSIGRF
jgi:solute carrier family 25 (mitochondrial folate transporter), member 32